jgi:hypothetical protein
MLQAVITPYVIHMKYFLCIGLVAVLGCAAPALAAANLVTNASFETIGSNGDPAGWLRGGYGQNTRNHAVVACDFYTDEDVKSGFVYRPECPPNALSRLVVSIGDYVDGDAKWYFRDVPIGTERDFIVSYDYQPYTYGGKAIARYAFPDGHYEYALISTMPQLVAGGMGYIGWSKAVKEFTVPSGAISFTIFFALEGNQPCNSCMGPDYGRLSVANVVLRHKSDGVPSTANLITNPSFETNGGDGNPLYWLRGGWGNNTRVFTYPTIGSRGPLGGGKAAKVQITNYQSGDAKWYFKEIPVTGGEVYRFSGLYQSDVPSEIGVYYRTPQGYRYQYIGTVPPASYWTHATYKIVVPRDATAITVFHSIYRVGFLDVDLASLTPIL